LLSLAGKSSGAEFWLRADTFVKTMPDSTPITMWGFVQTDSAFTPLPGQPSTAPGPLLTVPPGDPTLIIHLKNNLTGPLTEAISIVIPGLTPAPADITPVRNPDGRARSFVKETPVGTTNTYTWNNVSPGTRLYHSGTHPAVQLQMGLYGPVTKNAAAGQAYTPTLTNPNTTFMRDILLFFSEIDPVLHNAVATGTYGTAPAPTSTIDFLPKYFLINGEPFSGGLPPIAAGNSGETMILRFLNGGLRDYAPLLQGVYMTVLAEDGHLLPYPKKQYSLLLPAGKTFDATITPSGGDIPVYDRRLNLTNNASPSGGMLTYLRVAFSVQELIQNLVTKYYVDILARAPDQPGLAFWVSEINRIVSLGIDVKEGYIALGKLFFNSTEYLARNRDDIQYVTDLYQTFLGRAPDPSGLAFWVGYLTQGSSRNEVMNAFAFSSEFNAYMVGIFGSSVTRPENNLVNDFYRGILSRLPDTTGFNSWLALIRTAQCAGAQAVTNLSSQIALQFVQSAEYALRNRNDNGYVEDMYDAMLRRSASPTEVAYWVGILTGGATREQVLQYFTGSVEFQLRVQQVINAGCL